MRAFAPLLEFFATLHTHGQLIALQTTSLTSNVSSTTGVAKNGVVPGCARLFGFILFLAVGFTAKSNHLFAPSSPWHQFSPSIPFIVHVYVSVLPSRYMRMYTVYHVHIHMSEGLWFFNKNKKIKKTYPLLIYCRTYRAAL